MKRVCILGVNGNARDVLEALRRARTVDPSTPEARGFLDDAIPQGRLVDGLPVLGPIAAARDFAGDCLVNAIGSPTSYPAKPGIIARTGAPADAFLTILDPRATISASARFGRGTVVLANSAVGAAAYLGSHIMVLQNCVISHDSVIEDFAVLATGVLLSGGVRIGRNAYLGSGCRVREGVRIGEGSLVGVGAVVLKDVPPGEVWVGNPARRLRAV